MDKKRKTDRVQFNENWTRDETVRSQKKKAQEVLKMVKDKEGETIVVKHPTAVRAYIIKKVQK